MQSNETSCGVNDGGSKTTEYLTQKQFQNRKKSPVMESWEGEEQTQEAFTRPFSKYSLSQITIMMTRDFSPSVQHKQAGIC